MRTREMLITAGIWAFLVGACGSLSSIPRKRDRLQSREWRSILLDAQPAFTPDGVYGRLAGYGEAGRRNYSFRNMTTDVLLPLSVLPFLFLPIRRALSRYSLSPVVRSLLLSVPVAYAVFDLLENASVGRDSSLHDRNQKSGVAVCDRLPIGNVGF